MIRTCRKLRNYKARSRNGKKYIRRKLYCKTCGIKINDLINEIFHGECGTCSVKRF